MHKIVLGTAQFGMEYGINNKTGKLRRPDIFEILKECVDSGIEFVDTAYSYGQAERILGEFNRNNRLKIISKLSECPYEKADDIFIGSLARSGADSFYGYLIHNFQFYKNEPRLWEKLQEFKSSGRARNIGFSLYFPSDLDVIFEKGLKVDMIQIPFNIFDQRFESYFPEIKKRKIDICARSVFLQGLFFKPAAELDGHFDSIKGKIEQLNELSVNLNLPISAMCFDFVFMNKYIDKVVVGVDNLEHLKDILRGVGRLQEVENAAEILYQFKEDNEKMILPFNWS